jgi:hypothetical protein
MPDLALSIVLGIALAAATGFRVFLPMLIVSGAEIRSVITPLWTCSSCCPGAYGTISEFSSRWADGPVEALREAIVVSPSLARRVSYTRHFTLAP